MLSALRLLAANNMARPAGVEPAASRLEVSRSIQLSYGRAPEFAIVWIARGGNSVSLCR
jgi:hypothetical protein